jgi:hypothetical protein
MPRKHRLSLDRLAQEQERVRQACLQAVRATSVWGPRGLGRRSTEELKEEISHTIRQLDLRAPSCLDARTQRVANV